jgi:FtsZ-binding cell division protein ZapB
MSPKYEEDVQAGYAVVERGLAAEAEPATGDTLEKLQLRLKKLAQERETVEEQLREVDRKARSAIESEDAESAAESWRQKRSLLERAAELEKMSVQVQRQLEAEIRASMTTIRQMRADLEQLQARQDTLWQELIATAEGLVQTLKQADQIRTEQWNRQASLHARLDKLAQRDVTVPVRTHRRAVLDEPNPAELASKKWAVYDPDTGKLVSTLPELLRLLARWFPSLRTEKERVREFLALPNAHPLPARLKQELTAAGYFGAEAEL